MTQLIKRQFTKFYLEEEATTAVEYAIMLALIVVGSIAVVLRTGDIQRLMWTEMSNDIKTATGN